ncbi:MAG: TetR/AcrR family transcriptional regulator [Sphaerochaetaceae bacterium]|nr:TetR/AcrR family transcriptional regulator [Sphaerochaetaceae bacterium]MDY0371433.1 TetR/AcrR family transcriptional regulator [Sphaerochaetaceae bacterium]
MLTERQQEIIGVAMQIIVEKGAQKLTVRNVATAIGVSEPAIYRHFKNKHDLLVKLLEYLQQSISPVFTILQTESSNFTHALETFLTTLFAHIESNPAYALFVFTEEAFHADNKLRPLLLRMLEEMLKMFEVAIEKFQAHGVCRTDLSAQQLGKTMLGTIRLTVTQWHLRGADTPLTEQAHLLADTLAKISKSH